MFQGICISYINSHELFTVFNECISRILYVISGAERAKTSMHIEAFHKIHVRLVVVLINIRSKSIRKILSSKTFHGLPHWKMVHVSFPGGRKGTDEQSSASIQTEGPEGFSYVDCCLDLLCLNKN